MSNDLIAALHSGGPFAFQHTAKGRTVTAVRVAMASRGRTAGFRMSEEHRVKIQNSNILNALIEHVEGKRDMSGTQVSAGVALLKKVLPDLTATTVSGDPENPIKTEEVGNGAAKLMAYLDAIGSRAGQPSE